MSDAHRIAEAVNDVSRLLATWGAPEPTAKAHDVVNTLLRAGWRPRAPHADPPPPPSNVRYEPNDDYVAARRAVRAGATTTEGDTDA